MSDFLTRNRLVTAKVEVTPGTDPVPTPAMAPVLAMRRQQPWRR